MAGLLSIQLVVWVMQIEESKHWALGVRSTMLPRFPFFRDEDASTPKQKLPRGMLGVILSSQRVLVHNSHLII